MWKDLIVCSGPDCTFSDLITLVQNLITDLIILSTFLATTVFIWAGFLLLSSGGSEPKKDQAKKILGKVVWGYLWILAAWVIIYTISSVLLNPGFSLL